MKATILKKVKVWAYIDVDLKDSNPLADAMKIANAGPDETWSVDWLTSEDISVDNNLGFATLKVETIDEGRELHRNDDQPVCVIGWQVDDLNNDTIHPTNWVFADYEMALEFANHSGKDFSICPVFEDEVEDIVLIKK